MRKAFTLTELLVVLGIIVFLTALLLPMIGRARRQALISSGRLDLAMIQNALSAYHAMFGDYPSNISPGSHYVLGDAMLPTTPTGRVPAFLMADNFKPQIDTVTGDTVLLDRWSQPIQYLPRHKTPPSYAGPSPVYLIANASQQPGLFNASDEVSWPDSTGKPFNELPARFMFGDKNLDNLIDNGEAEKDTEYMLISAGPDAAWCQVGTQAALDSSGNIYLAGD